MKAQGAIDFALKDLDGRSVRLSDFRGTNVVLLDFWATWCVPCIKELPHFQRFHETYKEKGLVVLAVTVDGPQSLALVRPFLKRYQYTFPVLLDTESKVIALYNPRVVLPYTVLIDRDGNIQHARQGYSPGDEKSLEEMIVKLLEPRQKARERKYAVHANEAFLNRYFSDSDYVDRIREGREVQVINQLDLTFSMGDYVAGLRADANLDFSPWKDAYSLAKRFVEVDKKTVNLRLGDFYYTVGRGLAFSLLKTFEKEGLEYIIDTTVDGGKFSLVRTPFTAEVFGGWIDRKESDVTDKVFGGRLGFLWKNIGNINFNLMGSELGKGSAFGNRSVTMGSLVLDVPQWSRVAKFFGEFLILRKKRYYEESPISGHGLYLEAGVYWKNLNALVQLKDYRNLDFEYNRPPLLESEQIPIMANQFVLSAVRVSGVSGRLDYALPQASSVLFTQFSYQKDRPGAHRRDVTHVFVGFEKKFGETGWLNVLAGYRDERTDSLVFYYTHGRTFHGRSNLSYPLTKRLSLELDLEGKTFDGRYFRYDEWRSFLSFHYSPHWVATVFFDWTDDPEILFFKNKKQWGGIQCEFRFGQAASLRVFYGSNKGGVKCAGGVCKFFPPFEGLRIDCLFII